MRRIAFIVSEDALCPFTDSIVSFGLIPLANAELFASTEYTIVTSPSLQQMQAAHVFLVRRRKILAGLKIKRSVGKIERDIMAFEEA